MTYQDNGLTIFEEDLLSQAIATKVEIYTGLADDARQRGDLREAAAYEHVKFSWIKIYENTIKSKWDPSYIELFKAPYPYPAAD